MKFIIDDKIPYIKGALEPYGEVVYLPGSKTNAKVLRDADVVITRTRTACNKESLDGSSVKFIATATIGFDHIDIEYCKEKGIEWTNAPGCNAESVNQYIASALFSCSMRKDFDLKDKTIGIVGVGQVGSRVAKTCSLLGMKVLLNDPPREREEGSGGFVSLKEIQENSDIITFHVPLNMGAEDCTHHLVNPGFFRDLKKPALLVNSCRGEVFDTDAVCSAFKSEMISGLIIDCWENEPAFDLGLLNIADFGTPHIAGYSKDGKANGTKMCVQAVSRFLNLGIDDWQPENVEIPKDTVIELDGSQRHESSIIAEAIFSTYKIGNDDKALRESPQLFEQLRGDYPVRREFNSFIIRAKNIKEETLGKLIGLGFGVK